MAKKLWLLVPIIAAVSMGAIIILSARLYNAQEEFRAAQGAVQEDITPMLSVNPSMGSGTVTVLLRQDLHVGSVLYDGSASLYVLAPGGRGYNIIVTTDVTCPGDVKVSVRYGDAKQVFVSYLGESAVALSNEGPTQVIIQGVKEECK